MAQVTRAQKLRLGIFLTAGMTCLFGGLAILAGLKLGAKRDSYTIRWRDATTSLSGLDVGSPVKYGGIRVGRVDTVHIDPTDVSIIVVDVSLDHDTPIAEDSKANLASQGITGLKYIELTRGSAKARVRHPGEEIPAGSSLFDNLANQAEEIARKVNLVLDRVADLMSSAMKDRIGRLIERAEHLMATVDGLLADNRDAIKHLTQRLEGTSVQVEILATELAGTAKRANAVLDRASIVIGAARGTPEQLDAFLKQATALLADVQRTVAALNGLVAQSRHEILETVGNLRDASENASILTEKLKDDPTLLLRREEGGDE